MLLKNNELREGRQDELSHSFLVNVLLLNFQISFCQSPPERMQGRAYSIAHQRSGRDGSSRKGIE